MSTLRAAPLQQPSRSRPRLTVVPPPRARPARAPFVLLILGLLLGGMITLLLLNTALAEGSFAEQELQQRVADLADDEGTLAQEVAIAESPARLAERAQALGMVPTKNPAFLRLSDGAVLGTPEVGEAPAPPEPAADPAADPEESPAEGAVADPGADPATDPATDPAADPQAPAPESPDPADPAAPPPAPDAPGADPGAPPPTEEG